MAGAFPGAPNNLDLHTTDGGTIYQYKADHDRWVIYKNPVDYVEVAGDTMTGDLSIIKATPALALDGTGTSVTNFRLNEATNNRVLLQYDPVNNIFRNKLYQAGDAWYWDFNGTETMRLNANELLAEAHIKSRNGHRVYAYSSGNDKLIEMYHDDTHSRITATSGGIKTNSNQVYIKNAADNDYTDISANSFIEASVPLPDDPPNWKELLPSFVKIQINDGKEIREGINTGMVARLALKEVELLKKEIEELKKIVGSDK